jgi:hypothetical protein
MSFLNFNFFKFYSLIIMLCTLIVMLGCNSEERLYKAAKSTNDTAKYHKYIEAYPSGKYTKEAIDSLKKRCPKFYDVAYGSIDGKTTVLYCITNYTQYDFSPDVVVQDKRLTDTAFFVAVCSGEIGVAQSILNSYPNLNTDKKDQGGWTSLMVLAKIASKDYSYNLADSVLKRTHLINAVTEDGYTALMIASINENETMVKKLLEYGATVNIANKQGLTALDMVKEKNPTIAGLLKPYLLR